MTLSSTVHRRILSPPLRQALVSALWLLASQGWMLAVSSVATIVMFRALGPEPVGMLNMAAGMVFLVIPLVHAGWRPLVIRELTLQRLSPSQLMTTLFVIQTAVAALLALGLLLAASLILGRDSPSVTLLYFLVWLLPLESFVLLSAWFEARVEGRKIFLGETAGHAFTAVGKLAAVWFVAPLWAFACVIVGGVLIRTLVWSSLFWHERPGISRRPLPRDRFLHLLNDAWPFFVGGISIIVFLKADIVMLGTLRSTKEVGWYSAAAMFYDLVVMVPFMLTRSITPGLVKLREINAELYTGRLQAFYDLLTWTSIVGAIGLGLFGPWLLRIVFGESFAETGAVLRVLAWALPFTVCGTMTTPWILAENHQRLAVWGVILAAIANVVLNCFLIPSYGMYGAAVSSVICYGLAALLRLVLFPPLWPCFLQVVAAWLAPIRLLKRAFAIA